MASTNMCSEKPRTLRAHTVVTRQSQHSHVLKHSCSVICFYQNRDQELKQLNGQLLP